MNVLGLDLWIVASIAAAGFQTLRFVLQKVLSTAVLTPTGATFARFVYSAPIILVLVIVYILAADKSVEPPDLTFWAYAVVGGTAQVSATIGVVTLFKSRNFAVGVTLMKTEVILSVLIGLVLLGDTVSVLGLGAISLGLIGVLLLSTPPEFQGQGWRNMWNRGVLLGLGSGLLFAISANCYRGASLQIISDDPVLRAGLTLSAVTALQMTGMAVWLFIRDRGQLASVWRARRVAVWVGLMSLAGSFCWFFAFTLQNAAYVKAVGQVELIFSVLASVLFFSEKITRRELAGIAVLAMSILILALALQA